MATHILLVDCPDQRGLVHAITGALLKHGCNVLSNHEFVDHDQVRFFMVRPAGRIHWEVKVLYWPGKGNS